METNEQQCIICGSSEFLLQVRDKWICQECLKIGMEKNSSIWKESLNTLLKEYHEACTGCLSAKDLNFIIRARDIGLKIRAVFELLGIPKKHELLLAIRKVNRKLSRVREADLFLSEVKNKHNENKAYAVLVKVGAKRQQKQQKQMEEKIADFLNDLFLNKVEKFIQNDLAFYILRTEKNHVLFQYEERFKQLVDAVQQSIAEKGESGIETVKALHAVQKKSTSLYYIYQYLNETFGENFKDKEVYYKHLQQQYSDIDDARFFVSRMNAYEKKINAPKSDIDNVKHSLNERLTNLIRNTGLFELPLKEK